MKPVLVDTSVWRGFFAGRAVAKSLGGLLSDAGLVLVHPLVIGELVLGGLSVAEEGMLLRLPRADRAPYGEVLSMIRRLRLARKGIGWVDAELVTSTVLSKARLWSLDRSLAAVATEMGSGFDPVTRRLPDPS
jgi:hypothetical protein